MAGDRDYRARLELFSDKPDLAKAERLFRQAVNLEPSSFFDFIELGDIYLERELAIKPEAFTAAHDHSPAGSEFRREIEDELRLLSSSIPTAQIPRLRDPALE